MLSEKGIKVGTHYTPLHYATAFPKARISQRPVPGCRGCRRAISHAADQTHVNLGTPWITSSRASELAA